MATLERQQPGRLGRQHAPAPARERALSALLVRRAPTALECAVAFVLIGVAGVAIYGPHVHHGGLYSDDWAYASLMQSGSLHEKYDLLRTVVGFRPVGILSIIVRFSLLGTDARWHQVAVLGSTVVACTAAFLVLRMLRFERVHAAAIALLILACPYADATRLWAVGSGANIALTLWLLGVAVALRGMNATTPRRRVALHAVAVAFYVTSLLQYEIGYPVVCLTGALYFTRGNWRRVLPRSAADIGFASATMAVMSAKQSVVPRAPSYWHHAKLIFDDSRRVFTDIAVPFGRPAEALVLGVLAVIAVAALVTVRRLAPDDDTRRDLVRWLIAAGAGIVLAVAGWALFVAAFEYYHPLAPGLANRNNAIATPGLIITVYSLLMVAGTLLRRWTRGRAPAFALALAGALAIFIGFADRERASARVWDSTYSYERWITGTVMRELPELPPGSTVYTFGHPIVSENPGLPVFSSFWELNGAIQVLYHDRSLSAYPALPGTTVACGADGAGITGAGYGPTMADRYGELYLVDIPSGRAVRLTSRSQCEAAAPEFAPGDPIAPTKG